ncbi:acyltransferase [Thalassotalea sp. M1531]|uniref:Acyltransferase n=1 Tax=Thalassotalea algicola TaxID=2716224 RepID=A0A7Y0LF21_9GAMM|nr:1-acyl-sn-glycerol-3-phosphate acyltransferase [Thalassotalea algicola]NMP33360.1 acyltransferase [Thalassotalea algicola]
MTIAVPSSVPRARGKVSSGIGNLVLRILGWRLVGAIPDQPKLIFAVAPHTSNWDFVVAVSAMLQLNLKVKFLGKAAIFIGPFRKILMSIGGIPVNRSSAHGVVGQIVDLFAQQEQLIFGLAPEGTRSKTKEWKTGFLHIANKAQVPVVPITLDFALKEIRFYPAEEIGDDIPAELTRIKRIYQGACAKNPQAV